MFPALAKPVCTVVYMNGDKRGDSLNGEAQTKLEALIYT